MRLQTVRDDEAEIDVMKWFNYLTFDIFGDLAFGESFECLLHSQYHGWISLIFKQLKFNGAMSTLRFYPMLIKLLFRMIPKSLAKAKDDHARLIAEKVQRRLERGQAQGRGGDFMENVVDGDGEGMKLKLSIEVVRSTFGGFAVAASDTTAMALSAALNLLIHNEKKMGLLVKDVRGRFKGYDEITMQRVRDMEYLNAVLHETLRLYPPVPWLPPRQVPKCGATVCGKTLPAGVSVPLLLPLCCS